MSRSRLSGLFLLSLSVLVPALSSAGPADNTMYLLYNFSGKPIMAVTMEDSSGGQAVEERIAVNGLGIMVAGPLIRKGASVSLQWIAGVGRVSWQEVTLPIKIEHAGAQNLEIYFRPDGLVCASLVKEGSNRSDAIVSSRISMDVAKLSCARPGALAPLAPDMVSGFKTEGVSHSWELYDREGTSTLNFTTLSHATGPVKFRNGDAFRGGPNYDSEFKSVRMIGKQSALLVEPGMHVVTGDAKGWKSRFLGRWGDEVRLSPTRVMFSSTLVLDTQTADMFLLPQFPREEYWVMGLSPDGKHLAIYSQASFALQGGGAPAAPRLSMVRLEDGAQLKGDVRSLPRLPADAYIDRFYTKWYKDHCKWTPLLQCK